MTKGKKAKKQKEVDITFLDNNGIVYIYIIAFISLIFSISCNLHWIILFPLGIFLIYDIWFRWLRKGLWHHYGRDYEGTIASINSASKYTSFFIAFIAVSLSLIISEDTDPQLIELFQAPLIQAYGFIVLAFSGLVLLFIPIPYLNKDEKKEPSEALKNCFFAVLFMEKTIIYLLIYLITLILNTLLC